MEIVLLMIRRDHVVAGLVLLLLLFFFLVMLSFDSSSIGSDSDLLKGLVATRGNARVCFLKRRQSLLLGPLGRRDQILDRRVAFLICRLCRH